MVKGKSKGKEDVFEDPFAGKSYKNALQEVIKVTPIQAADFDAKAFRLLDALNEKGRVAEACELLQNSLKGVQRKRITNWRGYIYSLLRKVDEEVYHEMKESKEKQKEENGTRRRSKKTTEMEHLKHPASEPSHKMLDKAATEFVPGQPWKTPEATRTAPPQTLRKDAAEFVPTAAARAAQVVKAAQVAVPLQASLFPPMMSPPMPMPAPAMAFPGDFGAGTGPGWTPKREAKANGKATPKATPMKPDAQEFFPGVSAWAGAMVMPKQKAKAKARPRNPVDPGLVPSQPMSPGLQSGSREDTAASSPSRSPVAQAPNLGAASPKEITSKAISSCFGADDVFSAKSVSPKTLKATKECTEISEALTASECAVILSKAESLGFSSANRLVCKDPWLASALWERLSGVAPRVINGKRILGLHDDLVVQNGARSSMVSESMAVHFCLKSSSSASEGHAYILSSKSDCESDGQADPVTSWLSAVVRSQDSSWLIFLQEALGLAGRSRPRVVGMVALVATSLAASVLLPLLRRRLGN